MSESTEALVRTATVPAKSSWLKRLGTDLVRNRLVYVMALPLLVYYLLFHYMPMYGAIIAFKDFAPALGIWRSPWVGFDHFVDFFSGFYFWRVLRNTLVLSIQLLVFGFPMPILLALLLNEIRVSWFKRTVQTASYLPHFISLVVVAGLIVDFTSRDGIIMELIVALGGERSALLMRPDMFRSVYVISEIWQRVGWSSIIFLAALSGIDQQLYEAATIDGAGRFRKALSVTLPGIMPTVVILLILRIGQIMTVGFEKIILLYNPLTYETADVISTFVYRRGLLEFDFSFSTAVGLFNSLLNFMLLIAANALSRRVNDTSLW